MPTLLELTSDMQRLDDLLFESGGEVTEEIEHALATWASELDAGFDNKVDGYAALICELEARAEVRQKEAARLAKAAKQDDGTADFLRAKLKAVFEQRGVEKIKTRRYTVAIVKNGGKQPLEVDEMAVPDDYLVVPAPTLDRDRIRTELDAGTELAFAKLGPRGTRLSIR